MKKIMTLILAAALCLTALVGCGDNAGTDSNNYDSKTFKVAVVQQLDHSSLNEIRDAIEAELDAAPEGVTVTYENFNGQNDSTVLNQIGSQIVSGGYDAIHPHRYAGSPVHGERCRRQHPRHLCRDLRP